jgi:hypothetical protein
MCCSDLNRLLASSYIKTTLSSTEKPLDITEHYSDTRRLGWDLESIISYLAGEANVPQRLHQSILVDTSNASKYVVYIVTFSV